MHLRMMIARQRAPKDTDKASAFDLAIAIDDRLGKFRKGMRHLLPGVCFHYTYHNVVVKQHGTAGLKIVQGC
jgi:hypothetical protein